MLRIKQVRSYAIPRYPQVVFNPWRRPAGLALAAKGTVSAALLILLESCDGGTGGTGVMGPPPLIPDFLTENEARAVITNVFADNGIQMTPDVSIAIDGMQDGSDVVVLDGYNDSLRVGYEYVTPSDRVSFTSEVIARIRADATDSGPYITIADQQKYAYNLEFLMQAFIDTLKAHGKI